MKRLAIFWVGALVAAVIFAALTARFFPYRALRLDAAADRWRVWLLTLWTGGMLSICFGVAALLGYRAPLGVRDVADAGSVDRARQVRDDLKRGLAGFHSNFAWWLVATGGLLLAIYFVAWAMN